MKKDLTKGISVHIGLVSVAKGKSHAKDTPPNSEELMVKGFRGLFIEEAQNYLKLASYLTLREEYQRLAVARIAGFIASIAAARKDGEVTELYKALQAELHWVRRQA